MQFNKLIIMDNFIINKDSKTCILTVIPENGNGIIIDGDYFEIVANYSNIRIASNSESIIELIKEITEKITEDIMIYDYYIDIKSMYIRNISVVYI